MQQEAQSVNTEEAEEAAFLAENAKIYHVDESPAQEVTEQQEAVTQETEVQEEPAQPIEAWKKEMEEARAEIAKLRKSLDSTNGTYGSRLAEQQKIIDELRKNNPQIADQKTGQKFSDILDSFELTADDFEDLKDEFPELAGVQAKGLTSALKKVLGKLPLSPDISGIETNFQKKLDEQRQDIEEKFKQREIKALKKEHPDFMQVAGYSGSDENGNAKWNNAAFGNWISQQPQEIQEAIINGESALDVMDIITDYKNSLKQTQQNTRLNQAIQPKGSPPIRESTGGMDDEERAFHKEWKRQAQRF